MTTRRNPTKEWLQRAYKIDQEIALMQERIEIWRELAARATRNTDDFRAGSSNRTRMEDYVIKIADAEAELSKRMDELVQVKREIEIVITMVPLANLRMLLQKRYLKNQKWGDIASEMHYDETYIKKDLHTQALEKVDAVLRAEKYVL